MGERCQFPVLLLVCHYEIFWVMVVSRLVELSNVARRNGIYIGDE